jgi:hypothetical protein
MPSGHDYGRHLYASGRAIPKVLNFVENQPYVNDTARQWARRALETQTHYMTHPYSRYDYLMKDFLSQLKEACKAQTAADEGIRWSGTSATVAERACLDALSAAQAEANDDSFMNFFTWWSEKEGVPLTTLGIPEPFINFFTPQNSIRVRYDAITADAQCSLWWSDVQANQCSQ